MSNSEKPELSPEAIKMLNEMAANRTDEPELTPEAKANLAKLGSFHLTHTFKAYKNSYRTIAMVMAGLAVGALLFGLDYLVRNPSHASEHMAGLPLLALIPLGLLAGAYHFWGLFRKL
ncbi:MULTISPECIES: hypothetical protein [Asticcacaulis]|jgi:hypothetical protein|uniref:hypothetical protein n=1 Tax=Asticcacaulis TaxID=76890 RepID=UPI001AE4DFB1|nr:MULTISPECIES: hypothetical protein [Asticcacaulis]MBP2160581.1 hypothetical protein [Asticcacaulis solisilvae]MDR6801626.1 hypothetical protein [Asticcacaulis sp. BE141]